MSVNREKIRERQIYRFKSGLRKVTRVYGDGSYRMVEWEPAPPDGYVRTVSLNAFASRAVEQKTDA